MSKSLDSGDWTHFPRKKMDSAAFIRDLEVRFRLSHDAQERAFIADSLVPEYISVGDRERAAKILSEVGGAISGELTARLEILRAVVRAMEGAKIGEQVAAALEFVRVIPEPSAALVYHRAGLASFFARDALAAEEYSLQALWLADINGMRRLAAGSASVLYSTQYHLTGDLQTARYYAEVTTVEAAAAGDAAIKRRFLIAQYDLAAVFGDWERATSVRELLRREGRHEKTSESVGLAARVADVLMHGQRGDFVAMRGGLEALSGSISGTVDSSLIRSLRALALAGSGSDAEARREARRALGLSRVGGEAGTELAHLTIRRRIASVLAAYVSIMVGDVYHGSRALRVRAKWPGSIGALANAFESRVHGGDFDISDPNLQSIRGYAIVANVVRTSRSRRTGMVPQALRVLTHTEVVLLREAATGKTNGEIAKQRGVTRNAVERRLMSAYEKLGARTRAQAVAKFVKLSHIRTSGSMVRSS